MLIENIIFLLNKNKKLIFNYQIYFLYFYLKK